MELINPKVYKTLKSPINNAIADHITKLLSFAYIPYINPITEHRGNAIGNANAPNKSKLTNNIVPRTISILFLIISDIKNKTIMMQR